MVKDILGINNYINNYVKNVHDLLKIEDELNNLNYDDLLKLIKTNKVLIELISNLIKNEDFYDNEVLFKIVTTYCEIKKINILHKNNNNTDYNDDIIVNYLNSLPEPLSLEEEKDIALKVKNGNKFARQIFIERNLRLVVYIARRYYRDDLNLEDIIEEGNIGLIYAVDHYDVSKGFRFSTYAIWWIRQTINRAFDNQSRNIRLPVYIQSFINKMKSTQNMLAINLNREPTLEEIAESMNTTIDKLNMIINASKNIVSLDIPIEDDDATVLADFIADNEPLPGYNLENEATREILLKCIDKIDNERSKNIILLRYGFVDGQKHTLKEIGDMYNITRERVRAIEKVCLKKISENLTDFRKIL